MFYWCKMTEKNMSFMKHWFGSSAKPETNDEPRTVSKRPSSILRKGNNSSDSSDIFDPMCNDCSEGQRVSMAMSDNSSDDSGVLLLPTANKQ
jgi:hypothetical protein